MTDAPTPGLTSAQTVGPFFAPALLRDDTQLNILAGPETQGTRIRIEGTIYDGAGVVVPDALIEIWQANSHGRYHHRSDRREVPLDPAFTGFGRCGTDDEGRYWFETILPGPVPFDRERTQAPHICVTIFARGLLNHLLTRLYFADEPANANDPVLQLAPAEQRGTLLAARADVGATVVYRFDIILQGAGETVFFNV
ncbi:MAG: protocatechuate 3,4-dioxygenase subunit alpha [Thermomicrobiales bacterium]